MKAACKACPPPVRPSGKSGEGGWGEGFVLLRLCPSGVKRRRGRRVQGPECCITTAIETRRQGLMNICRAERWESVSVELLSSECQKAGGGRVCVCVWLLRKAGKRHRRA